MIEKKENNKEKGGNFVEQNIILGKRKYITFQKYMYPLKLGRPKGLVNYRSNRQSDLLSLTVIGWVLEHCFEIKKNFSNMNTENGSITHYYQ